MPSEPSSEFVAVAATNVFTDSKLRRWRLDFDETVDPPTPVFTPVLTWTSMKAKYATWGAVRSAGLTWGIAKGL